MRILSRKSSAQSFQKAPLVGLARPFVEIAGILGQTAVLPSSSLQSCDVFGIAFSFWDTTFDDRISYQTQMAGPCRWRNSSIGLTYASRRYYANFKEF
jgi:hypothetical protein